MQEQQPQFVDRRAGSQPEREADDAKENETNANMTLEAQLADAQEKAQSYLASWQRAAADYQNYKRRVESEREETARLANAALVINLLPLIDDLERALDNVDVGLAGMTWLDGIRLIHRKFQSLLEAYGIQEIQADGQTFDPNVHEAVMHGDGPGYVIHHQGRA